MRRLLFLMLLGLAGCPNQETQATVRLVRAGGTEFTAQNGAQSFAISVLAGTVRLGAINLVDFEAIEETPLVAPQTTFDFFAQGSFTAPPVFVQPRQYEQVHVIPSFDELALEMVFAVTRSDGVQVEGTLRLQLSSEEEEELETPLDLARGEQAQITIAFDATKLLQGVDFDALGASGDFTLDATQKDPAHQAAQQVIAENLFTSFALVSAE